MTSTAVVAVVTIALALWSVPRAIQGGDAGEFATVMLTGGVPHPTGYPWMRALGLLARAGSALGLPPMLAAALPPALCGVGGWLLVHRCCAKLGHAWIGALVVVLAAASPVAVIHVNDAEVWGPHLLFGGLFIYTATHMGARVRPFLLGITIGVAVSHHLTAALLVPLAIGAALPHRDTIANTDAPAHAVQILRNGALGLAGSAVGLLPYASLAIGRGGVWRWGRVESLDGLLAHVLRRDYGTASLSLHQDEVAASDCIARALSSIGELASVGLVSSPWMGALTLGALVVLAGLWLHSRPEALRPATAIGWLLALGASALLFPALGNIDPSTSFGAWILERFDLLTVLLATVPACLAVAFVAEQVEQRMGERHHIARLGGRALAVVMLLAQLGAVLERGRPASERGVELAAIDLVSSPDPRGPAIPSAGSEPIRAIVFGTDDHRTFPVLYVQTVLGAGAHTLYVDAMLLAHPWYRAYLRRRVPSLPDVDKPLQMIGAIWSDPELAAVPIYFANEFSRPAARQPKIPEGMLWRVPPPPQLDNFEGGEWTAARIVARHLEACARMQIRAGDFGGLEHPRGHPWSADLWFAYVDKARRLAASLAASGHQQELPAVAAALAEHTGASL